ncbi:nucleotidyl transferase AbiEii/AbiGii toxin family protein [Novilysobacter erysipheiresistens]|uniref:Nucleotidyl transferase AbiEii/AbiGii toxin family protein n=1 Tax=Novilysobacter erysipheiresistens TaxID=1749332 RepID=A0ABU7YWA2_9GAMM
MSVAPRANRIASIRQRLLDRARARGEEFQFVLDRFAVERLLYRLSQSAYRDEFVLKGAMLFALWFDQPHRPTRDADFLGFGPPDAGRLAGTIRQLCAIDADDGLRYDTDSITVEAIREEARYDGLRVTLLALLGNARCTVQWDVGFGDAVTPAVLQTPYPTLLDDMPAPDLRVYPRETVFAEKLEAIAQLGIANSRMKDYFDLLALVRENAMNPAHLANALRATFERRGTPVLEATPFGLSDAFADDAQKKTQWQAFLKRNRLQAPDLEDAVTEIRAYVTDIKEH